MSNQRDEHRSPAEAPTIDVACEETRDVADSFDDILRKVVKAHAPIETLEPGAELGGRFKITRVLGEGGMGTVYVARDTTLGREVAIKLHHAAGGARRLRREAVAMAKLAHPNVVTVFEVGDLGGRPFVVMEYIVGTTLRAWLAMSPRSVGEILEMVTSAGEGLAAAHDAGLVHRDFKPENVLIGTDGRARVGDFGLARELDSKEEPPARDALPAPADDLVTPLTQTGTVLGTPAYMSPEQFEGAPVDARSDQFAFCVTVWEALWKERPFEGASFVQLQAAITMGTRRSAPAAPKVPARVRRALERGLSTRPTDRFPSMHALLEAMRPRAHRRRRWLVTGSAAAATLAGVTAFTMLRGSAGPSCEAAGAAELAALRRDLPALLSQRGAGRIAAQVFGVQQLYLVGFRSHARAACEAGRAREWSPAIVAKSQACFAMTARTAALSLASLDPGKPMAVLRHIRRLPPTDQCRNPTYLASRPPIPSDPDAQRALIEAGATLAVGFDSIDDHDYAQLRRTLTKLESSPARTDPGVAAGMTVLRGWLAYDSGKVAETRTLFVDAYYAARAVDDELIASVALSQLIDHSSQLGLDRATIAEWLRTALADADRVRARSPWLAGRVYTVAARAADLAGDARTALTFVARAREVLGPNDPTRITTFAVEGAVLMWSGRVDEGVAAYETALAQTIAATSPDDPEVAHLLSSYASSLINVERIDLALATAERASRIIGQLADPSDDRIDPIRVNLAAVLLYANKDDEAHALFMTARANNVRRLGEANTIVANIDVNLSAIYIARREYDRAIAALKSALATQEKLLGADHSEVADVLYNLAAAYRTQGSYPDTIPAARRAAEIYGAVSRGSDRHRAALTMVASAAVELRDYGLALEMATAALDFPRPAETPQTTAWSQLERARALLGLRRHAEARPLLTAARATYARLEMTHRIQQLDTLLAQLPRSTAAR